MARESFIVVPVMDANGRHLRTDFIPSHEYHRPVRAGPYIFGDIKPYKSPVTREPITSRSRHREHLKETNCIEVGNELPRQQPKPLPPIEADIKRTIETLRGR
jgi:hypothetical protein